VKPSSVRLEGLADQFAQWQLQYPGFAYLVIEAMKGTPFPDRRLLPSAIRPMVNDYSIRRADNAGRVTWHLLYRLSSHGYHPGAAEGRLRNLASVAGPVVGIQAEDAVAGWLCWLMDQANPPRRPLGLPVSREECRALLLGEASAIDPADRTYRIIEDVFLASADALRSTKEPKTGKPSAEKGGSRRRIARRRNESRDAQVARWREQKTPKPWDEILDEVTRLSPKRGWDVPSSGVKALEQAYRRYQKRRRQKGQQ
jgi:hypothetical protein